MAPDEFDTLLHDAEVKLARLRALYEQYFQGIEKLEPHIPRKDLERSFELLRKNQPRNTALRFRLQQLIARYGTYVTYWQRIARQIEEGTYRRDLAKVRERNLGRPDLKREPSSWEIEVDVDAMESGTPADDADLDAILGALKKERPSAPTPSAAPAASTSGAVPAQASVAPAKPAGPRLTPFVAFGKPAPKPGVATTVAPKAPAAAAPTPAPTPAAAIARPAVAAFAKPAAAPPVAFAKPAVTPAAGAPRPPAAAPAPPAAPPPAAKPASGLDERTMRGIYERFADARKKNNEGDVRYESLAASVDKMLPTLREKHAGKKIDFEVVVANGRVGLKPKIG